MAKRPSSSSTTLFLSIFIPRGDTLLYLIAVSTLLSLLLPHHLTSAQSQPHFEGFDAEDDLDIELDPTESSLPLYRTPPPPVTLTPSTESHHGPPPPSDPTSSEQSDPIPTPTPTPASASSSFDNYWDEDEFEGLPPQQHSPSDSPSITESAADPSNLNNATASNETNTAGIATPQPFKISSFTLEITCVTFLIIFIINYFTGKNENEAIALAWVSQFATKDSIFEKNFSFLGVGETDDSPLLLKEGQTVFKFYASGRRFCQGMLATLELKSRQDLISRLYNMVVPCKDEITFEVFMNDDAMDQVIFALAKKKLAKTMAKEVTDLKRFAGVVATPNGRKWVPEELAVVSESKEVAGDLLTDAVLEQVLGDKAFEKFGKGFISMHFSDQYVGSHKKMLVFKFALPDTNHMADMSRLVALVPYYIDLIGRYKLSSYARSKTDAARQKIAQEIYRELHNARQEALQRKKAEQRKKLEEAEAKLSAEALRKKEAKDRARQMKKAMPKMKMTRAH